MPTCASARSSTDIADEGERARRRASPRSAPQVARQKEKALAAGGLYVLGTERHESRRIDNQLRGRSGRQGDPGHSKFFLSLQDDLMRIFGSDSWTACCSSSACKEGEAIAHPWINKALEKAQQKVEARNFDIRKNILKYDNVMNDQRKVIFEQRIDMMSRRRRRPRSSPTCATTVIEDLVAKHIPEKAYAEQWDAAGLKEEVAARCSASTCRSTTGPRKKASPTRSCTSASTRRADEHMAAQGRRNAAPTCMRYVEKAILLQTLDHHWREHIVKLDHLRQVIGLRGYGQRDPLNEYKAEAFELFEAMLPAACARRSPRS